MAKAASTKSSAAKTSSSTSKASSSTKSSSTKSSSTKSSSAKTTKTSSKAASKTTAKVSTQASSKTATSAAHEKSAQRLNAPTKASAARARTARSTKEREEDEIVIMPEHDYDTSTADHDAERSEERESATRSRLQRPTVRYSDEELEFFRKHIEAERKKALEEFQILKENLEDITNSEMADENASYSMHMAEQGSSAQEKEKIYAQVQRIGDYIKKLEEALQRIDDKVYGICKMCGILIAKERLLAVPITTQSASYKIFKKCPEDGIDRIVRR